jgi:hypothetical protein
MKKIKLTLIALIFFTCQNIFAQAGVAINEDGSTANKDAILDVKSTTKGFLPPRMTEAQRSLISPNPPAGLIIYNTTTNKPNYYNGSLWMNFDGTPAEPLSIGDFYNGGVVFYIFKSGDPGYVAGETHGLVCAISDQSNGASWGCGGTAIAGADGLTIGTGYQNTTDILAGCTETGTAAQLCRNISGKWFLPSRDELNAMYQNKDLINTTAVKKGGSAFANSFYWSSSESSGWPEWTSWALDFSRGLLASDNQNTNPHNVRAIKAF